MTINKVSLATVQKVQQLIHQVLVLPDTENCPLPEDQIIDGEMPEPDSLSDLGSLFNMGGIHDDSNPIPNCAGHWYLSSVDPGAILFKVPGLQLKPGITLVSYLYRLDTDGIGSTWAIPQAMSTTAQLEAALATAGDRTQPPQPTGALDDVMDAITGDLAPASFVVASILRRELQEFGAIGTWRNWQHHRLIEQLPPKVNWQWKTPNALNLTPKVRAFPDGKFAVEFFTCRVTAPVAIYQHIDQYPADSYRMVSLDRPVAVPSKKPAMQN